MRNREAYSLAVELLGTNAVATDYGMSWVTTPEQRANARTKIARLKTGKPEGWRAKVVELEPTVYRQRYAVGVRLDGLFVRTLGAGDTWEEAFEHAIQQAPKPVKGKQP
jgi:hypothetical protein